MLTLMELVRLGAADETAPRLADLADVVEGPVAPTVAEWLGAPPPRDAVGRSVLDELRGS
jgi:hypothetical protein